MVDRRGLAATMLAGLLFGTSVPVIKLGLNFVPPNTFVTLRFLFASALIVFLLQGRTERPFQVKKDLDYRIHQRFRLRPPVSRTTHHFIIECRSHNQHCCSHDPSTIFGLRAREIGDAKNNGGLVGVHRNHAPRY